jgi:hypothetical protein
MLHRLLPRLDPEETVDLAGETGPERRLWAACLWQAIRDADEQPTGRQPLTKRQRIDRRCARLWLQGRSWALGLALDAVGVDRDCWPSVVQRLQRRWRELDAAEHGQKAGRSGDQEAA